jgi:hypothetical protein
MQDFAAAPSVAARGTGCDPRLLGYHPRDGQAPDSQAAGRGGMAEEIFCACGVDLVAVGGSKTIDCSGPWRHRMKRLTRGVADESTRRCPRAGGERQVA